MPERSITITAPEGLHARPAAELVRLSSAHAGTVRIRSQRSPWVDAASVLAVMMLAVDQGDTVIVEAEGERSESLLDQIEALLGHSG